MARSRAGVPVDRRLGLRRRRRHPGRPEGVRALRRARDDGDHGDHGAEHASGSSAVQPVPPTMIVAQVRAVAEDIGVDAVKIGMLGDAATIAAVARRSTAARRPPVVVDPVMVAESGARLLDADARARAGRADPPARDRGHAERARGAGAGRARRGAPTPEGARRARCWRSARGRSSSPAAIATRPSTSSPTATRWSEIRASATPTAPPTAPDAPTPRSSRRRLALGDEPLEAARTARVLARRGDRPRAARRRCGARGRWTSLACQVAGERWAALA